MKTSSPKSRRSRRDGSAGADGYENWAEYYDFIHQGIEGEAEFYVGQAVRLGGKTLELGCGTGRIAIPMAMSGADVTGLDCSRAMLAICRSKRRAVGRLKGRLRILQGDMRDFSVPERFRFIAMPYRTFMHLQTPMDQRRCLSRVCEHLEPGGRFILNVWRPSAKQILPLLGGQAGLLRFVGRHPLPASEGELVHFCATSCDEQHQTLREEHVLHEIGSDGRVVGSRMLTMDRVWTTPREMEQLALGCGFEPEAVFGDFDCSPLDAVSTEQIWVLRKP